MIFPKVEGHSRSKPMGSVSIFWATMSIGLLCSYVLTVVFLGETINGNKISTGHIVIASLSGFVFFGIFFTWVSKRGVFAITAIRDAALAASVIVLGLVSLDVLYSIFLNSSQPRSSANERFSDSNTWIGELYPELYFPTAKNFRLHKPGRAVTGSHYGDMYKPMLMASPLLASSVFSKKHVTISINDDGFRETGKLEEHKIFSLGDSFTFGWGVDQSHTWTEVLERSIGKPIYNMGIHDSSPKQEFLLLKHIIDSRKLDLKGGLLLWMIFEGNDLEDSYDDQHLVPKPGSMLEKLSKGTIVAYLWSFPALIQQQSVFTKFRTGQAELLAVAKDSRIKSQHMIDGIVSPFPLYVSRRFGAKLFSPDQLKRAQNSEAYVESHPNRLALQKTFQQMELLASQVGFRVMVVIAPTDARLYGSEFEEFPHLSGKPYFNILVAQLSAASGFDVVNLEDSLRPSATKDLLYFRDDDHWNERGHAAVADVLGEVLRSKNIALLTEK